MDGKWDSPGLGDKNIIRGWYPRSEVPHPETTPEGVERDVARLVSGWYYAEI